MSTMPMVAGSGSRNAEAIRLLSSSHEDQIIRSKVCLIGVMHLITLGLFIEVSGTESAHCEASGHAAKH
jgi:hypothetical protein